VSEPDKKNAKSDILVLHGHYSLVILVMSHTMNMINAEIVANMDSEFDLSDEEEEFIPDFLLQPPFLVAQNNGKLRSNPLFFVTLYSFHFTRALFNTILFYIDEDVEKILEPVLEGIQRIRHIKIINYIENIVTNYDENDFIMHFRLSREISNELIGRFTVSPTYLSLQGSYVTFNISV